MENKKNYLMILVIVQSIIILGLVGYVLYDKLSNDNNKVDNPTNNNEVVEDNNNNDKNEEVLLTNDEALEIVKDLSKKYIVYDSSLGVYCGEYDRDDYISFGAYETQDFRDYWASTTYKSINELKEFYESVMVEDLIPKYLNNGVSYLEQDGKLYCQLPHKGPYSIYNENESTFEIKSLEKDRIVVYANVAMESIDKYILTKNIEFVKDSNGKWLVSKYDGVNYYYQGN